MSGFNPNRLREIRLIRKMSLEQLAENLGKTKQAVSKYELGKSMPSSDVVNKLLNFLNVPRKCLIKDDVLPGSGCSPLFLRAKSTTTRGNTDFANIVSRWGYEIVTGLENASENPVNFPEIDAALPVPEKAFELRRQWGIGTLPIENMVSLLERKGFFIFVTDSAELNTDAYSRVIKGIPIIVLNKNKGTAVRWRFSLAHELGHLILHRTLSGNDFDIRSDTLEDEANLFAEYFLMPKEGFENSMMSPKAPRLEQFISLKKEWGVSIAAMVYHSGKTGLIEERKVKSLRIQMSKLGWRKKEPLDHGDGKLEFETPEKLQYLISRQITGIDSFNKFFDAVRLPVDEIERLCSLPENYFSDYLGEITAEDSLYYINHKDDKQLSLFREEGSPHA